MARPARLRLGRGAPQRTFELREVARFHEVVVGAGEHAFLHEAHVGERGQHEHGRGEGPGDHAAQHRDPVEVGKVDVEQHHVGAFVLENREPLGAGERRDQRAAPGEREVEGFLDLRVVVDEQDFQHATSIP